MLEERRPLFLELGYLDSPQIEQTHAVLREAGLSAVPVVGVYRDGGTQKATAAIVKRDRLGVCLRVTPEDIAGDTFHADLDTMLEVLQVGQNQVDVVLDGGYLQTTPSVSTNSMAFTTMGFLSAIPYLDRWRSLTYVATAFPPTLESIGSGTRDLPRIEWDVWQQISKRTPRPVRFGDYAVAHPGHQTSQHLGSAAIRYTVDDQWLIARGRKLIGPAYGGFEQFRALSRKIMEDPRFCGPDFSWGDRYITRCADGTATTGNATTWRAVATNHHLAFLVNALATRIAA